VENAQMDISGLSKGYNLQGNRKKILQIVILIKNLDKKQVWLWMYKRKIL
jgi:hypothetical protein